MAWAVQIRAEQMERYRRTARARWQAERKRGEIRRERAGQLARQAATLLKECPCDFALPSAAFAEFLTGLSTADEERTDSP